MTNPERVYLDSELNSIDLKNSNRGNIMIVSDQIDLHQILELQKKVFYIEAVKHDDLEMQPMTQTLEQIIEEFCNGTVFFKLSMEDEIVGSVRAKLVDNICFIGKLVVDNDKQNRGIGTRLIRELEAYFKDQCSHFKLYTGEKSEQAIRLYTKLGYQQTEIQNVGKYFLIHMEK